MELFTVLIITSPYMSYGYLSIPLSSQTRHQLIIGLGVPLNLENESVNYGWTLKIQYFLPESTTQQLNKPNFNGFLTKYDLVSSQNLSEYIDTRLKPFPFGGRRKREILTDKLSSKKCDEAVKLKENVQINNMFDREDDVFDDQIDNQGNIPKLSDYPLKTNDEFMDTSGTRWLLYDGIGRMLNLKALEGRYCVLRSICEAAESNFGYHNGLFGELFHLLFTPSSTSDVIVRREHYDYIKAEMLGQAGEPCDQIFHQCKRSLLEIFTKAYDVN